MRYAEVTCAQVASHDVTIDAFGEANLRKGECHVASRRGRMTLLIAYEGVTNRDKALRRQSNGVGVVILREHDLARLGVFAIDVDIEGMLVDVIGPSFTR